MNSLDRRIGWIGIVLLACFVLLFVQLNNIQVKQARALNNNPINQKLTTTVSPFVLPRGEIISADGVVLAYSSPTKDGYGYLRIYPRATAGTFAGITGYYATALAANPYGVEASYDKYLSQHESPVNSLGSLLDQHEETDNVYLTISTKLQAAAAQAMNASPFSDGGGIVVLDPRNGDVLAMYSNPTYDPNLFSVHSKGFVTSYYNRLTRRPVASDPLINNATETAWPPGSTMKVITTSAAYDKKPVYYDGDVTTQKFPPVSTFTFPRCTGDCTIQNYNKEICPAGGTDLAQVLAQSCDTAYAMISDQMGALALEQEAHSFGFCIGSSSSCLASGQIPPLDIPDVQPSTLPPLASIATSSAYTAYTGIGQYNDRATPLEMALVAAGIADNGVIMAPHLVSRAVNSYGNVEFAYRPHVWLHATSSATAQTVRQLMTGVTKDPYGTATGIFAEEGWYSSGLPTIAAKTGTAQPGGNVCGTYNWLIATGPADPGQTPTIAAAAMIPVPSSECSQAGYSPTGASVAGPVLIPVLKEAFALQQSGAIP